MDISKDARNVTSETRVGISEEIEEKMDEISEDRDESWALAASAMVNTTVTMVNRIMVVLKVFGSAGYGVSHQHPTL